MSMKHRAAITQLMSQRPHGLALVLLIFILAIISTTVFVSMLPHQKYQLNRDARSNAELNAAKEALIGYALVYPIGSGNATYSPGRFPCQEDTTKIGQVTEGESLSSCSVATAALGRLPWKTISSGPFRDGNQSQVWYALSPIFNTGKPFANDAPFNNNAVNVINSNLVSPLLTFNGQVNHAIAIVMSPGAALAGQNRPMPTSSKPPLLADYLEGENANGDNAFNRAVFSNQFNDQLLIITPDDLFIPLEKRVIRDIQKYLVNYRVYWGSFPFPAAFGDPTTATFIGNADQSKPSHLPAPYTGGWLPVADPGISVDFLNSSCKSIKISDGSIEMGTVSQINSQVVCNINNQGYSSNRTLEMIVKINHLARGFYKPLDTKSSADFTYVPSVPTSIKDNSAVTPLLDSQGNGTLTFTSQSSINSSTYKIFMDLPTWDNWANSTNIPAYIAKNYWHHLVLYKVAKPFLPGGTNTCDASNPCLSINTKKQLSDSTPPIITTQSNVPAVLISAGRPLNMTEVLAAPTYGSANPAQIRSGGNMTDYFDSTNNVNALSGLLLDANSLTLPISTFNDQLQVIE